MRCGIIATAINGMLNAAEIRNRRFTAESSPSSVAVGINGSSAMPQIGQLPGPACLISGCMGQV